MRLNSIYLMLVRKKMYFSQKFAFHYYSSGNSHTHLFCWILDMYNILNLRWGWVICCTLRILHSLGKIKMKLKEKKNDKRLTWPTIFEISIKTQVYGYLYGQDKIPAILLILLILALLLRKLSTMGGVVIHHAWKR